MSISPIPRAQSIRATAKNPMAYALLIVGGVAGVFVDAFLHKDNESITDCKTDKAYLQQRLDAVQKDKDDLMVQLLIKNGVIDRLNPVVDSSIKNNFHQKKVKK